jgi:hypothetical protein
MKILTQQTILLTKPYKLYTMASIIKTSINLDSIDKTKIINGKKGKYLPIVITLNDEVDQFGNQGPVIIEQSKEDREAKAAKIYLGNVKVVWSNGQNVDAAPREDNRGGMNAPAPAAVDDLPF